MTHLLSVCRLFSIAASALLAEEKPITLWPEGAPRALGTSAKDIPTLTPCLPAKPNSAAMLLIPGGSYSGICEGQAEPFALWLNEHGLTDFVLRYRLGGAGSRHPAQLQDAVGAMFQNRGNAEKWKIGPQRIGVMGFPAGGHLVPTLINRPEDEMPDGHDYKISPHPDLAILCHPVIGMINKPRANSRKMLIGDSPDRKLVRQTSSELQVKPGLPHPEMMPSLDCSSSALIEDMHQCGLLEEALVCFITEMGRAPRMNKHGGRDHWARAMSIASADAGRPGGAVTGAADREGGDVTDAPYTPYTPYDYAETICRKCSLPDTERMHKPNGIAVPLSDGRKVIQEIFVS